VNTERGSRWKQAGRWGALVIAGIGYSLLAHKAASSPTPSALGAAVSVLPLLALAFAMAWRSAHRALLLGLWLMVCVVLYTASGWLVTHYHWVFLLDHASVYALLGLGFGKSLRRGSTPMVTRFAGLVHTTMSPALNDYTRAVTWAWTLYFGGVCMMSLLLFWLAPIEVWSTFAILLGAPMLVLMFAAEYAVRFWALPPQDRAGPLDAIRAWRQSSSNASAHHS